VGLKGAEGAAAEGTGGKQYSGWELQTSIGRKRARRLPVGYATKSRSYSTWVGATLPASASSYMLHKSFFLSILPSFQKH
jgi:hypothetical protein